MRARQMSPFGAALFSGLVAGLHAGQTTAPDALLENLRAADGPDEEAPVRPTAGVPRLVQRQTYGPAISVGTILMDVACWRTIGSEPVIMELRDEDGALCGLSLYTYEAR